MHFNVSREYRHLQYGPRNSILKTESGQRAMFGQRSNSIFSHFMTNKRHKVTKIKCKRRESTGKESLFVELNFAVARSQKNSKLRPEETQLEQIYI